MVAQELLVQLVAQAQRAVLAHLAQAEAVVRLELTAPVDQAVQAVLVLALLAPLEELVVPAVMELQVVQGERAVQAEPVERVEQAVPL